MLQRVRIFLSSPGDVAAAREIAAQTIEKLAQDFVRHSQIIEPYMWEHEAMVASGHFQDSIEPPSAFDIVVLILWSRLGTPLPVTTALREYRGIDGRAPVTGTEWEYEEALKRAREEGTPDLLVYRSLRPSVMNTRDAHARAQELEQLDALDQFWARHFADQGRLLGAYTEFTTDSEFAAALEGQLRKLIEKRLASRATGTPVARSWTQAPFRGLESYEFEHAPIYFGQDDVVGRAMLQLEESAHAGAPFLLVLGASGSGKSSLVKAGIAPKLFVPRRITGAAFLRRVIFRPSDTAETHDLFEALALRLTSQISEREGFSELASPEVSVANLAAHLRGASAEPVLPFRLALANLAAAARADGRMLAYETARLVLVIDQLEELFTSERFPAEDRRRFIDLLAGFVRSGLIWVIATMRADFWHFALETPELVRLSEGRGRLDLLPPSPAQLSQMIRRPAVASGVTFEVHRTTNIPLNEVIAEEVAREPGALPLLSYLLDQLYRADVLEAGGKVLTFATYEKLGKLEGAIAAKAEAVLARCDPADREALGSVLFSLVQMGGADGDVERAVARRAPLSVFAEGTAQRRLVDALLDADARLLVSDAGREGGATVRVAHEALITRWPRAREFVLGNAAALKVRHRIEERYVLWPGAEGHEHTAAGAVANAPRRSGGRFPAWQPMSGHEPGLLTEMDLTDARRLLAEHRSEIEPHLADYIERSAADEKRVRNRSFRLLTAVAAGVALLAIVATVKQHDAEVQAGRAVAAQSRLLTQAAAERLARGDVTGAEAIIMEVLAERGRGHAAGSAAAVSVFQEARAADTERAVLSGHAAAVETAAFSPDGRSIVTASDDRTARIWDAVTGAQRSVLSGHQDVVNSAAYSPDGRRIVTASQDRTARIWDAATGAQIGIISGNSGAVASAAFSPDGQEIVTASGDKTARIWNAGSGAPRVTLTGHGGDVTSAAFSPDGKKVVTASVDKTARVWDAATGRQVVTLSGHAGLVNSAVFSPDGKTIVTASADRTARLWDAASGAPLRVFSGHGGNVNGAAFSPDGKSVVTTSDDQTARMWNAATGVQMSQFTGHRGIVYSAAFSPDGRSIVTASFDGTARVWALTGNAQLAVLSGHTAPVQSAEFAPDGGRIVTASNDQTARIWASRGGAALATLSGHDGFVEYAAFSPDGRRVVTASSDRTARVWDAAGGGQIALFSGHGSIVYSADYSPDGRRIATASDDGTARVWDAITGAQRLVLHLHGAALSAAWSPDGRRIVTASFDKTARIWDAASGAQRAVLSGHGDIVNSAAFSPDGRRVVTASSDRTVRIWDAESGAFIAVLSGHEGPVYGAAYSPDGRHIVTASDDRSARIWDASSGAQLAVYLGHDQRLRSAAYSPDGRRIVTASADGTARIWDANVDGDLGVQMAWARAGQFDPLRDVERANLGLTPEARRSNPLAAMFGGRDANLARIRAKGDLARSEEERAAAQTSRTQKDRLLLSAFRDYAAAAARGEANGLPDEAWRHWRYRRATIARLLGREGMMREVADAFLAVDKR